MYVLLLFSSGQILTAQKTDLWVKRSDKGLYLEHKVVPRESFFSVGRKYNVNPRSLATFNNLDINKGLQIDQKLRIPLTDSNFTQKGYTGTPVFFKAKEKELADASKANNNVSVQRLREWNNLSGDQVKEDSKLIIGFLQSREFPTVTITPKPVKDEGVAVVKKEEKPAKVEEEKKTDPVVTVSNPEPAVDEKKEASNGPKTEEKKTEPVVTKIGVKEPVTGQGYFKKHFEEQVRTHSPATNETVTAGIFKTLSGWEDAKYYLLIDKVQPGTIIKVINPENNKAIYAKVLGQMSGIRQNEGLSIRISNAAAAALEVSEQDKFIVSVNY